MEGRTITIEYRWSEGRAERFVQIAAEIKKIRFTATYVVEKDKPLASPA